MKVTFEVESNRFLEEVINQGEYAYLFKDLVIIDGGCNIGAFSLYMYDLARKIYAIDMVQENIQSLNKTIADNTLTKIATYCIALSEHTLPRKYMKDPVLGGGASQITSGGEYETKCTTVGKFMQENDIPYADILKLDIEGLEHEVLQASDFPKDKIQTIIGEIHSDGKGARIEVRDILIRLGYRYSEPMGNHFLARK